jgi:hypothetical protein
MRDRSGVPVLCVREQSGRVGVDCEHVGRARVQRRGYALERVARHWLGRADLGVEVVGLSRRVEVVGVPSAAQSRIARLPGEPAIGQHERLIDGQALRDVAGDGVAVQESRVAVLGVALEEAGTELDRASFAFEQEPVLIGVDREQAAPIAVVDP